MSDELFMGFAILIICGLALVGAVLFAVTHLIVGILMLPLMAFLITITEDMHLPHRPRFERREDHFASRFDRAWELASSKFQPY